MADVFISYSKAYADVTRRLAEELENIGLSVWWDTELVAGESYRHRIQEEINASRAAIVIWTPDSLHSEFVISEAARAHAQRKLIQVRTSDVAVKDIPPPFDVSHVPVIDDRKAITGALHKLGLLQEAGQGAKPLVHSAWAQPVQPASRARTWLPMTVSAVLIGCIAYFSYAIIKSPRNGAPVVAAPGPTLQISTMTPADDPAKLALSVSGELLKQLNAGLPDTSVFEADVRLSQRGVMSRIEAAGELRKFGARYAKINCRHDTSHVDMRAPEHSAASFRAKVTVLCDLTEKQGKTQTKRFPLEIEVVRSSEGQRIAGLWQPEEMVLWQRRERGK